MKSGLPCTSRRLPGPVEQPGTDGLRGLDRPGQGCFAVQLNQPMDMVRHDHKCQGGRVRRFIDAANEYPGQAQVLEDWFTGLRSECDQVDSALF